MSRSATFAAVVALTLVGCSMFKPAPEALPVQPIAPTKADNMTTVGDQIDKSDSRVAAAVTVAQRNADKPEVVKAETSVALSYLPKPSEGDVAYAAARAAKIGTPASEAEYAAARDYGKKLLARIDANWAKMEADQAEAKRVSQLKDARIVELQKEIERVKKDAAANLWTMAGIGCCLLGAVTMAFGSPKAGVSLLICGGAIGAFPFVIDSPYFAIIAGSFLAIVAGLGIWYLWDKVRDKVHESDEQAPPQV